MTQNVFTVLLLTLPALALAQNQKEGRTLEEMASNHVDSLDETARAFYEDTTRKLEDLFIKAAQARSTIFAQSTFEGKRFDRSLRSKLERTRASLEAHKKALESIIQEINQALPWHFYAQPQREPFKKEAAIVNLKGGD